MTKLTETLKVQFKQENEQLAAKILGSECKTKGRV